MAGGHGLGEEDDDGDEEMREFSGYANKLFDKW
jgi:hypothetical protein